MDTFEDILTTLTNYYNACFQAGEQPKETLSLRNMYEETVRLNQINITS